MATPWSPRATKEYIDASGPSQSAGATMDIELAVDALELAAHVDEIVLFSGDGDFRSLVVALQRRGVRVTVVSTISCQPPLIADELRRQAEVLHRSDGVEIQGWAATRSERPPPRDAAQSHAGVPAARPIVMRDHGDHQRLSPIAT